MGWFRDKLDDHVKALASQAVAAYIERAQLLFQVLLLEPPLSPDEIAVSWVAGASMMAQSNREETEVSVELVKLLYPITREFYDSLCQSLMENLGRSSIKLSLDSEEIAALITPTLKQLTPERRDKVFQVMAPFTENSVKLAGATLALLGREMKKEEAAAASKFALNCSQSRKDLNTFEKAKTKEWLTRVNWSSSS
jgi:hypothetical protein